MPERIGEAGPIQVTDVTRAARVSRRTQEHLFRDLRRRSPHEEIQHLRITRATALLETTELTNEAIVFCCGFQSAVRFYRSSGPSRACPWISAGKPAGGREGVFTVARTRPSTRLDPWASPTGPEPAHTAPIAY